MSSNDSEYCDKHSAHCVRLDHIEGRVCVMEKRINKILTGIALVFLTGLINIALVLIKGHV